MHISGVRFGGLDEMDQILFEHGKGSFPGDFVGSAAGKTESIRVGKLEHAIWKARGKSKRTAWEGLDLGNDGQA